MSMRKTALATEEESIDTKQLKSMSLFNNPFTRVCTSGFGTGTDAGKALGYTVLICGFCFMAVYYAGKGVCKLVKSTSKKPKDEA